MKSSDWTTFLLAMVVSASAWSQATDQLVQAPELSTPERGSLVGQYARTAFGPADVSRGGYQLPAPMAAPTERGPLLTSPFPTYSPDSGISECGIGWEMTWALTRSRPSGDLDYASDDLSGPWGRMLKGSDDNWYPAGLHKAIRLKASGAAYVAYLPDGSEWTFGATERVEVPGRGTYAWYLEEIRSQTGQRMRWLYQANPSGRRFVDSISYGGDALSFPQYRIQFTYQPLANTFDDYRPGFPDGSAIQSLRLDRRVSRITLFVQVGGQWVERWNYALGYTEASWGPAFFLTSVTYNFASGEFAPPAHYTYGDALENLRVARWRNVDKLDSAISRFGADVFQPNRATLADDNLDGRMDFEHSYQNTMFIQGDGGFEQRELPTYTGQEDGLCRHPASPTNSPRALARIRPDDPELSVVGSSYSAALNLTEFVTCNLAGFRIDGGTQTLSGRWTPDANTRFVDLNRDLKPDLLHVDTGFYWALPNESTPDRLRFGQRVQGTLFPQFAPIATWVNDFNGDGLPDIIARNGSVLEVWYGKGNFQFVRQAQHFLLLETPHGPTVPLDAQSDLTFVDANHDGLTDLLLKQGNTLTLFVNTGTYFLKTLVPALPLDPSASRPVVADLLGSGNTEVVVTLSNQAKSLSLDGPDIGLLTTADDGKGTVLIFSYERSPAVERARKRQTVLSALNVASSGYDPITYRYRYAGPTLHREGKFLVGFDEVVKQGPQVIETAQFLNSDFYSGLLSSSTQHDDNSPLVDVFRTLEYEDVTPEASSLGIFWKRLRVDTSGWRDGASGTLAERTEYQEYEAEVCAKKSQHDNGHGLLVTQKTRASLAGWSNFLHCLEENTVLTGTHSDSALDFRSETSLTRNSAGLVERVQSIGSSGPLTLQEVVYNPDYTIDHISAPGRGTTSFAYEGGTRLLRRVTTPDFVVTSVSERDPVTDAIRVIDTNRGAHSFQRFFRYDGQERLAKTWDDFGQASQSDPNQQFAYQYATASRPAAISLATLLDFQPRDGLPPLAIFQEAVDLMTAAGEPFTTARRIPEGWTFDGIVERKPSRAETNGYLRPTVGTSTDVLSLDYSALLAGADRISSARSSAFDYEPESRVKFHSDVEKQIVATLALGAGGLVQTATENEVFITTRTLGAGKRVLTYEDEAHTRYTYRHDALGRLREVRFPNGRVHRISYDDYGRLGFVEREGIASIEQAYDATTGLLTLKRFFSAARAPIRQVNFDYDAIGRKSAETFTDLVTVTSPPQIYRYYYDGATPANPTARMDFGFLSAVSGDGAASGDAYEKRFEYRADGVIQRQTVSIAGWRKLVTDYDYFEDKAVKETRSTLKDPSDAVLSTSVKRYNRDSFGRISQIRLNGQELGIFGYNSNGKLNFGLFAAGDTLSFDYDGFTRRMVGRTQRSASSWTASTTQWMNERGLVNREELRFNALNLTRNYTYSPTRFLVGSVDDPPGNAYDYDYDSFGLPILIRDSRGERRLVRDGDTLIAGDTSYRFDTLGRTVEKGDLTLSYGPNGHIARAQRGSNEWTFLYDEGGQRLVKFAGGTPVAGYLGDSYLDASGLTEPVRVADKLIGVIQGGALRRMASDLRGTVTANADGAPRIASPFGDRAEHPDIAAAIDYVEKGYDADLGLVRMGVRDYDATINLFLTPDPLYLEAPNKCLTNPVNCNLYAYASNLPLNLTDPSGMDDAMDILIDTSARDFVTGQVVTHEYPGGYDPGAEFMDRLVLQAIEVPGSVALGAGTAIACEAAAGPLCLIIAAAGLGTSGQFTAKNIDEHLTGLAEGNATAWGSLLGDLLGRAATGPLRPAPWLEATERMGSELPSTLARVVPGEGPFPTLGPPGAVDVFVTSAEAIRGLNAAQLSIRLGITPRSDYTVFEFKTPTEGLASPVFREAQYPNFVQGGFTSGKAPEFVIPNGPIPPDATRRLVH